MKNLIYPTNRFNNQVSIDALLNNVINGDGWFQPETRILPLVNVKESPEGYQLELAVPGYHKEDFHLAIENNLLTIRAKQENKEVSKEEKYTRKEFSSHSFSRSFTLPKSIDAGNIKAVYVDGILKIALIHLPELKKEATRIPIS